jgi:FtsH-binding integral membrane protein
MSTVYDFMTMGLFAVLAVIFLHRSTRNEPDTHPIWMYALAGIGCASANFAGNHGYPFIAVVLMALVTGFLLWVLGLFEPKSSS